MSSTTSTLRLAVQVRYSAAASSSDAGAVGAPSDPEAVLIVDETGDLKKGRHTVGVQRQYSGTAGKIENCQLAVHLVYATTAAHSMRDTALYLPRSWCDDTERRTEAGIPDHVRFATKPQLAARMIEAAVTAGMPCR
ncbi:IS701 family transposase [Micromonospora sp. H33]|uniref:IS701 family transposase n=1 Tax=Micromonospora sp. H33 TaxID=3452215 RepID=UPI003F8A13AE